MARLIVRAWVDIVCPTCWDFCPHKGSHAWYPAPLVEVEMVNAARPVDEPVQLEWVDVESCLAWRRDGRPPQKRRFRGLR